jgi:hypothetical protein|tara:strand:- start:63 stop:578 length:516 start_codon:yes stop_codon:yes gene_type:complete
MAKANDYVDNEKFFSSMCEWKTQVEENEKIGEEKPPITEYIGECFWKIAEHLSFKSNFANYPFKDDMVGDAVENCIMYAHNFDPEKSKNPFSYFTQITYYAFIRRIEREKKQNFIKFKIVENLDTDGEVRKWLGNVYYDSDKSEESQLADYFSLSEKDIEKFTPKKKKKSK